MHNLFVTYPRSGQQLMAKSIISYFGKSYNKNYCEFYSCCSSFPCSKKKEVLLHKNHDFNMRINLKRENVRYAVGIRHPYDSLLSYHDRWGNNAPVAKFFKEKANYWVRFVEKWILPDHSHIAIFEYKKVVENYEEELARMILHFWPDHKINESKIQWLRKSLSSISNHKPTKGVSMKHKRSDWKCHSGEMFNLTRNITKQAVEQVQKKLGFHL